MRFGLTDGQPKTAESHRMNPNQRIDLEWIAEDGRRAKNHEGYADLEICFEAEV